MKGDFQAVKSNPSAPCIRPGVMSASRPVFAINLTRNHPGSWRQIFQLIEAADQFLFPVGPTCDIRAVSWQPD